MALSVVEWRTGNVGRRALAVWATSLAKFRFLQRGIRINAIMPGSTDTPLARSQTDLWLGFGRDYRDETGTKPSIPAQRAYPVAFLCSDGAAYVNGITTDLGYMSAGITGRFRPPGTGVGFLLGKL